MKKLYTIKEIKDAVDKGLKVKSVNDVIDVIKDKNGNYLLVSSLNQFTIGLHGKEGTKYETVLNGTNFYIKEEIKNVTVQIIDDDINIECPNCENWEQQPVDQQRHHLQSFNIEKWLENEKKLDVSQMQCTQCKTDFKLIWDYNNTVNT
jgi:hypothetical protein